MNQKSENTSKPAFPNFGTVGIWGQKMFRCLVYCRIFGNISGLCPLDASSTPFPPSSDNPKFLKTLHNYPEGRRGKITSK